ncbi:DUF3644 domain-containing protein [Nocardia grenadensis]|uniref:DUF3644 domain-containing protein n=1 Tax=Nocardia grenadensis TaxID=931537 RepID=UPI003D754AA5
MAPYVSARKLIENSLSAMLSAIELYNKPRISYRDELVAMLIVNSWELALKAALRKSGYKIFYKKRTGVRYLSLSLDDSINSIAANNLWPDSVDGRAAAVNLQSLSDFRDRAIHLYNAKDLGTLLYPYIQQSVINYRDFVVEIFSKDLADSISWQLLPLGATSPPDVVQFMQADTSNPTSTELADFLDQLRIRMDKAEADGADMSRIATVYDINLQSVKKVSNADLQAAISNTAEGKIIIKKTDPNETHPYSMNELIARVNAKRSTRQLTSYDLQVICWKEGLRNQSKYAWRHNNAASYSWSGDAVRYLTEVTDERFTRMREEYRKHQNSVRTTQK